MAIVWRKEWLRPFESSWSIIEKIKCANHIDTSDLVYYYGTDEVRRNPGEINNSKVKRDLFTLPAFDHNKINNALGRSLNSHIDYCVKELTSMLPDYLKRRELFRSEITYCRECMKIGYHSFLHQFVLIEKCPFHGTPLESYCLSCNKLIPHLLTVHKHLGGYICQCGEALFNLRKNGGEWAFMPLGMTLKIQSLEVKKWLQLTQEQRQRLKSSYFDPEILTAKNSICFLSSIAEKKNVKIIKGPNMQSKTLRHIIKKDLYMNVYQKKYYDEIYESIRQIIKSFEHWMNRIVLIDHQNCIRRYSGFFSKNKVIKEEYECPVAVAYVNWKWAFLRINMFYYQLGPRAKSYLMDYEFPIVMYVQRLLDLVKTIENEPYNINNINVVKWCLLRGVWNYAKNAILTDMNFNCNRSKSLHKVFSQMRSVPMWVFSFSENAVEYIESNKNEI